MIGKILSRSSKIEIKNLPDVWKAFGMFEFFNKSASEGFEFIFDVFESVVKKAAYYIYSFSEASQSLVLESMRLRTERMGNFDEEVIEALREPELKLIFREEYKNLGFALIWAGKFLNIPLYHSEKYIGSLFSGPYEPETIDKELLNWFRGFANACAIALRQIKFGEETRSKIRLLESQVQVSKSQVHFYQNSQK